MKPKPSSPSLDAKTPDLDSKENSGGGGTARSDRDARSQSRNRSPSSQHGRRDRSDESLRWRREAQPTIEYPDDLPITAYREELRELIQNHSAVVVCGETGSGKSTQLPKICLEAGLGRDALIGHTQPRRLAARSIAARLADELETPLGEMVGFKVRFGDQTGDRTLIKLMTDGILLAETQSDRMLDAYDAIIIDEAHERSLNIDFLLGYLKQLQQKRRDLKIIITSATIDAERFAEHFADDRGPAPIISVEGRGFPVQIKYLPWDDANVENRRGYDLATHVIAGIDETSRHGSGDALVFLPTERDIREVSHRVAGHYKRLGLSDRVDLLPLYARLPQKEQHRIFHPDGKRRRVIFATNVAESSLTVPGIHYVIDAGTARISRYSSRSKMQRLPIESVSRASADQRAGRCGRIGPGVCVRLYSLDDYESRESYTTPEIRRTNLAAVVLRTKTLRLGSLADFPLLDPPRPEAIRDGVKTLTELGAIDDRQDLTDIGWQLGRLPVDPRVGRILLAAEEHGCLPEVLPIAAALEIQDPRDRPPDKKQAADEAHEPFLDGRSDFLSMLRLWRFYDEARAQFSRSKLDRELRKQFLSPTRMREWSDVYRQLREMVTSGRGNRDGRPVHAGRIGAIRYEADDSSVVSDHLYEQIHCSLLSGLLSGVANIGDKNEYTGAGGLKLYLWPGSGVFESKPKWIVAAEFVETSRQFARTVARIQPGWIERIGAHLIKRSHSEPHWSRRSGGAFCFERQTLFGLPVVARRRVPLSPIDPATARDLLIDHGLTEGELRTNARFVRQNQAVIDAIAQVAARTRKRDYVVDDYQIARFYQARLPAEISDRGRLEKLDRTTAIPTWAKGQWDIARVTQWLASPPEIEDASSIYLRPDDLLETGEEVSGDDFPDEINVGQSKLPLEYKFEPGSERDGIQVKVHQAGLSQLSDDRLGWLVPGLLQPKLIGMIKSLPKRIRRNLVPAADVAAKIAEELTPIFGTVPFMEAVCQSMSRHAEMPVKASDFQRDKLDAHHDFVVAVVDDLGATVGESRDLSSLRHLQDSSTSTAINDTQAGEQDEDWHLSGATSFDIDALPEEVIRSLGGVQVAQYPALVDLGDRVETQLFSDGASARTAHLQGLTRLYAIAERKQLRNQVRHLPNLEASKIKLSWAISSADIENAMIDLLARIAFVENETIVRTSAAFESRRADRGQRIAVATQDLSQWFVNLAQTGFEVRSELESIRQSSRRPHLLHDVEQQISWLFCERFLVRTPWCWLQHYPRYLKAIAYRIDKATSAASRDEESTAVISRLWSRWLEQLPEDQRTAECQTDSEFRWMIEELRVSLFAQPLGTSVKVSPQRCEKLLK